MTTFIQDLRFALRTHLATPVASLAAVFVLAVGIGATTAIFSVVEGVLLRSLPFRSPEQLVGVGPIPRSARTASNRIYGTASRFAFDTWRAQHELFEDVAGYTGDEPVLSGRGEPVRVTTWNVTGNFFSLLGAAPRIGRAILPADTLAGAPPVVVLSHASWTTLFSRDPAAIGQQLTLDGLTHTIVGVMPARFRFPDDAVLWRSLGRPSEHDASYRFPYGRHWTVARLQPGITPARALQRLDVVTAALGREERGWEGVVAHVIPLRDQLVGELRRPLLLVLGAVAFVLLVACANVANIQLARGVARRREIALRLALGARRGRVLRQLLTESVALGLIGAGLGVLLAYWGVPLLVALGSEELPRVAAIGVNLRVLGATLALAILTGIAAGLAPALQTLRHASAAMLRSGSTGGGDSPERSRLGSGLVVAQIALTMVLLAGAALLTTSLAHLLRDDTGFRSENVLVVELELRNTRHAGREATLAFADQLLERVRAIPGVSIAAVSSGLPLHVGALGTIEVVDGPTPAAAPTTMLTAAVPEYFRALGIPLLRGRMLNDEDAGAIVVNDALVRAYFPRKDQIGRRITFYGNMQGTIVGVVGDTKAMSLAESEPPPHIYYPFAQHPAPYLKLVARVNGNPTPIAAAIRSNIRGLDPELPIDRLTTMRQLITGSVSRERFYATLLVIFAAVALLISAAGLYGVISYTVIRRTREIGIRTAIGATSGDILRAFLGRGLLLTFGGILLGAAGSLAATRLIRSMLFEVEPGDPRVLGAVALLLTAVAVAAICLPARRAAAVQPIEALRAD